LNYSPSSLSNLAKNNRECKPRKVLAGMDVLEKIKQGEDIIATAKDFTQNQYQD